jgi:hypothetical protein
MLEFSTGVFFLEKYKRLKIETSKKWLKIYVQESILEENNKNIKFGKEFINPSCFPYQKQPLHFISVLSYGT